MVRRQKIIKNKGWIRNKHQLGSKASIKSLRRYCKEIWAELVKERDNHKCIICGKKEYLNSHHIITAKCLSTRFNPNCGITLCSGHHMLLKTSAHCSPWVLYDWLKENRPKQYNWFKLNRTDIVLENDKTTKGYYLRVLKRLMDTFEREFPTVLQRSKYYSFTELEEKEIIDYYIKDDRASLTSTADNFNCSEGIIKGIFKRNKTQIRRNPGKHRL